MSEMSPRTIDDRIREELLEPGFAQDYAEASEAWDVAIQIAKLRQQKGLTQAQLAELVGTRQQDIARIENPAYKAHSLGLLRRIARALGMVARVEFVPPALIIHEEHGFVPQPQITEEWLIYPDMEKGQFDPEEETLRKLHKLDEEKYAGQAPQGSSYRQPLANLRGEYQDAKQGISG